MHLKNLSNDLNSLKAGSINHFLATILICLFPAFLVSSSILTNLSVVCVGFLFLFDAFKNKKYEYFKNKIFILLSIFFLYLIINFLHSQSFNYIYDSPQRSIGFIRFILLAFAIPYYFNIQKLKYLKLILSIWSFIFVFISIDLLVEYFYGRNLFGMSNVFPGRLSGVMGDELKIGAYFLGFYFIFIGTIIKIFKYKKYLIILSIVLFTLISFLIGERANFLKLLFGLLFFLFFLDGYKTRYKVLILSIMLSFTIFVANSNQDLKDRFLNQFINYIVENGITQYYYNSQYGAHFGVSIKIFKNYPLMGIGIKNFMEECYANDQKKYDDERFLLNKARCNTHPHQLHLEILSQLGIIGYSMFLLFFIWFIGNGLLIYKKNKNIFHLGALTFVMISLFMPLPSGSFFTSFGASIFWINFGLALTFQSSKIKN